MSAFGRRQKKLSEQSLQARQFSTSSMPYGECIATLPERGGPRVMAESMAEGVQERYSRSMQLQQEFCCDWGKDTLLCGKCSNDSFTSRRDPLTEPDSVPLGGDVDEPGEPTHRK